MSAHALLSPSSASRWLECTPSARLEAEHDDTSSDFADEGTLAHKLGEWMIKHRLNLINLSVFKTKLASISKNKHYNDSMYEYCDQYAVFVMEKYNAALEKDPNAKIFLEVIIDLTEYIPEGFGTGDVIIVTSETVEIIDLKYGKGVKVDAIENKQMMLYALGILNIYNLVYDIDTVIMTIYQPRIDNFSTWELSAKKLLAWAERYLRKQAKLAWEGKGEFKPGKHCQFCRVRTTCKANAEFQMQLAEWEFKESPYLTLEEIAVILEQSELFISWVNSIKDHALKEALAGKKIPGHKLVTGRSTRVITEVERVKKIFQKKGYEDFDYLSTPQLLGITALEKRFGAAGLQKLIGKYIDKPDGKPALVSEDDSRPEYNSAEKAKQIFSKNVKSKK